ncbi:hypothetical protein D9615_007009 [Tricholomella constricta]|uniref:Transmembrane protein n=1 Tax=Tricholomella constricta TaxID=117010 RepID=A0A8H5H8N9_9AGAR|nr:hypothetical protein D9615_007009 [Tricholomella constricta]
MSSLITTTTTNTNTVSTSTPTRTQSQDDPFGWPLPAIPTTSGSQSTLARNSSYFLGFLITFCVLLVVFIGCGIASRRHLVSRRRRRRQGAGVYGAEAEMGAGAAGKRGQEPRPVWVERWVELEKKEEGAAGTGTGTEWNRITPLATTIVRPEPPPSFLQKGQKDGGADIEKQEPQPQSGSRPLFPALSAWLAQLSTFRDPRPVLDQNLPPASPAASASRPAFPSTHPPAPADPPAEAHVAVMIAMPLRPENAGTQLDAHAHGAPPEYQIGVACVPVAGVLP